MHLTDHQSKWEKYDTMERRNRKMNNYNTIFQEASVSD